MYESRLFKANYVAVRIEHLLQEGRAGARMPGQQGDAPGRLAGSLDAPAVNDRRGDSSRELLVKALEVLKCPRQGYCRGALKRLRLQQSGHRLVVLAFAIQHLGQVVCCPDTDQRIRG